MSQHHKLYTPADSAVVFIDQQPQMTFGMASADRATLINNVTLLAHGASWRGAVGHYWGFAGMAARLGQPGTLRCAHGYSKATGRRLRRRGGIRLHDGSPRSSIRAETADRAEEGRTLSGPGRKYDD